MKPLKPKGIPIDKCFGRPIIYIWCISPKGMQVLTDLRSSTGGFDPPSVFICDCPKCNGIVPLLRNSKAGQYITCFQRSEDRLGCGWLYELMVEDIKQVEDIICRTKSLNLPGF